jgi:hypothetical protein
MSCRIDQALLLFWDKSYLAIRFIRKDPSSLPSGITGSSIIGDHYFGNVKLLFGRRPLVTDQQNFRMSECTS